MRIITAFFICLGMHGVSPAQGSSHPTPPAGTNSVALDPTSNEYLFRFRDRVLYRYNATDHPSMTRSGATLHAIRAVPESGEMFRPSNAGGIVAEFGATTVNPWTAGVSFARLQTPFIVNDTVVSHWRMLQEDGGSLDYHLRLSIRGRTLTIVIGTDGGDGVATGFTLDRCEAAPGARVVRVPYLPLFNLLFSGSDGADGIYTSLFFDWESTNASSLTPFRPRDYQRSSTSVSFSQNALYLKKTDGTRNRLSEVVYLTFSPDLSDVLPNLAGSPAPLRDSIAVKTVISYNPPFTWLLRPFDPPTYNFIDSIHAIGLRDVALIIKNWQRGQFDHKYPSVLPPNSFDIDVCTGRPYGGGGGTEGILLLKQKVNAFGYEMALHENYVDYYADAGPGEYEFHPADVALLSDGSTVDGWLNCSKETSRVLKPSRVEAYAGYWSARINEQINPSWSYLDVHTALDPTKAVDFDATVDGAGKYAYTIQQYRAVASALRTAYGGPVQGEGHYQMLYAGYFDDFEGRLHTVGQCVGLARLV